MLLCLCRMPKRSDIHTTKRANYSETDILSAVKRVVEDDGAKIRAVALEFKIDRMTLTRYVKKFQNGELKSQFRYWGNRSVFTEEEEVALSEYLQTSCKMYFGLARNEVMKLAYEYGDKINKQMPTNWIANCSAGKDWYQGFMRRHPQIALRSPEATSIARASSFNPTNVGMFFDLLESVKSRYTFDAKDIYNVDETGCMTVQKTGKVVAPTGLKQVSVKQACFIKNV